MKIVKSGCAGNKEVRTCTFSPQVNIKNKRKSIQTQEDVNAAHSEAKIQDLLEDLKNVIWTKVSNVATSDSFGFDEDEVNDYFFVDVTPTEIGEDHHEAVRVEVRAEVSYEGLEELMDALNPIIESYDSYAYFEPVEPGIIEAYVSVDQVDMSVYGGSEYANSSQSEYTNRAVLRYKNKSFTIYDNSDSINLPADADLEALRKWKAQISQQAGAYNDADEDYEWASLSNGVVSYYRRGKLVDKSYYMSPSDWDVETLGEWSELVINDVIENLYEANRDVPDHMVYNSTDIEASTDDKAFIENIEDIIDGLEDNGYDLSRIRSIRRGLLELFGYKGKDADIIIHDLVAGGFIDPNDWVDKDYTPGIYSATKEEYKTSENYKGRRIRLLNDGTGYAIFEKDEMIDYGFKSLEDAEAAIDEYDDIYQDDVQVYSATEEDEEDLPMVDQEYDSAATSINSNKLPAIYKMVNFNEGDVIVDFGGGKFDNAVEYIRDKGATLCVYDPYNRSAEHNKEVLRILRENGGADAAVNSNVLNVIKEPEARKNVLENIARITKPGAPIYITVYEGKGDGQEGPTKSGYQLNRKTADYLEEIQEVFPDATRRGKLITAHNSRVSAATDTANIGAMITCSDVDSDAYVKLAQKKVLDSDGFYTDYTMYSNEDGTSYIFMFGDEDIYGPDPQYADYECSNWDEAAQWWNDYNGFVDDITSSTILDANPEFRNNFEEAIDFFYESYPATVELTDEVDEDYDTLYKAYVKETGSLYQQTPGIVYIDIDWDSGEILQALQETAEAIGIEQYPDDDIEMSTFSDKNDVTSSTIKASYKGKRTCRIDHYGAFDNDHVLHNDWRKMSNEEAELLAKQYSQDDPEDIYYVHYDNIMDPASDYVWYQGEPYMSGDLVYRGDSVDVNGTPVSEDEVLSYTSVQADYNDRNLRALEDEWLSPPEYDEPIEHEDSEELVEVELNQVITVDVDGDYEWDDDTYVWASPDRSNEEWRSEDGVYIDDKVGVVEHIDDLIIPNVPTRPGKYRVTGLAELIYDVSGIQEYRTNYGPDDYESDLDTDHAVVSFNFRKSSVENLKITPVRR